jgi:hypothetical protein
MVDLDKVWEAFARDVPEDKRDDVLTRISEAAHDDYGHPECKDIDGLMILDRDRMDAINVRISGTIQIGEDEHWFILQDGNWNGTQLEAWDDVGDKTFERHQPTQWAVQPNSTIVASALSRGKTGAKMLLLKWEAVIDPRNKDEMSELPRKYAYDRHMQPGCLIENHYTAAAAKRGFVIVTQEEADETKKRLQKEAA